MPLRLATPAPREYFCQYTVRPAGPFPHSKGPQPLLARWTGQPIFTMSPASEGY